MDGLGSAEPSTKDALYVLGWSVTAAKEGLRRAEALAREDGSRLVLLVPHVPADSDVDVPLELIRNYATLPAHLHIRATVYICVCDLVENIFRWCGIAHARVVLCTGLHDAASRDLAAALHEMGHDVIAI